MGETHRHCQCDNCSGEDCGQDNPDKLKAEQEAAQKEHDDGIRNALLDTITNALNNDQCCPYGICDVTYQHCKDCYRDYFNSLREGGNK